MKDFLLAHNWIPSAGKGLGGTALSFAFISMGDIEPAYKIVASLIGGTILVLTLCNTILDFRHKRRRDKKEEKDGFQGGE